MGKENGTFDYSQSSKDLRSKYKETPSKKEKKKNVKTLAKQIGKLGFTPSVPAKVKFTSVKDIANQIKSIQESGTGVLTNHPQAQQSARETKPAATQKSGNPLYKYGCVKGKK